MIDFRKTVCIDRLPNSPGNICKLLHIRGIESQAMPFHEIKPVAAPGDISRDLPDPWHLHGQPFLLAVAGDILNGYRTILAKFGAHDTDACFDAMGARL